VFQGAYVGVTTGLILTLWIGIGALVYKPPILGHTPPAMNTDECPYLNGTEMFTSTTPREPLSTSNSSATVTNVQDMYV